MDGPIEDPERLAAVARAGLLHPETMDMADRFTELICEQLGVPVAAVTIVEAARQLVAGQSGMEDWAVDLGLVGLDYSVCQHVVDAGSALIVSDAREDPRVSDNLAVRDLGIVAYAGVPLTLPGGHIAGAVCAVDTTARTWKLDEVKVLLQVAAQLRALLVRLDEARTELEERPGT